MQLVLIMLLLALCLCGIPAVAQHPEVQVIGKTAIIGGPFTPGPLAITIAWADGTQALNYFVSGR